MSIADRKLKRARAEIEAIMAKYDIAGVCVLHNAPGSGESFGCLSPSYSNVIGVPPSIRLKSVLADYRGNTELQRKHQEATANMVSVLAEGLGRYALALIELSKIVDAKFGAEHTETQFEPDPPKGSH